MLRSIGKQSGEKPPADTKMVKYGWMEQGLTSHSTQYRSFRRRSPKPISWLSTENNQTQQNLQHKTKRSKLTQKISNIINQNKYKV